MEGMNYIRGPGASFFPEKHYEMMNLRARDCTGEFLIFKYTEISFPDFCFEKVQYEETMLDYLKGVAVSQLH